MVKWNNIPKRNEIKIGQSLIVSDPTKVKQPEGFVWLNSANSTFSEPKTVKEPEEYLWWASGNSPRTNSPVSNQPLKPLSTTASNKTQNAQSSGRVDINLSDPKQYPGINIYQNNDKSDMTAVTLPGFGIYIGGGFSGRSLNRVIQHEYGHYLDYRFSLDLNYNGQGFTNFYLMIGVPSLFNAATDIGGSHSSYWTEIRANKWAEIWFGKNLDPDF